MKYKSYGYFKLFQEKNVIAIVNTVQGNKQSKDSSNEHKGCPCCKKSIFH